MISIFHGDNQLASRNNLNSLLDSQTQSNLQKYDAKETTPEKINMFLNGTSLFLDNKVLVITNYFSISKPILDKLNLILSKTDQTIIIWQDKKLTSAQLKTFPDAKVTESSLPKTLFVCLNNIKPKNSRHLIPLLRTTLKNEPYELFLYLLKANLRKQLTTFSQFDTERLKRGYLSLIELEFQTKTGTLSIPKEIALERILVNLMR